MRIENVNDVSKCANLVVNHAIWFWDNHSNTSRGTCGLALGALEGLEAELTGALPAGMGGCGGRTPLDDVIETTYSVLALGALEGLDDTITNDGAAHDLQEFPFLAPPPSL